MVRNITVNEALAIPEAIFIDVRSPEEYSEDSLPQAVNVPLLNDEQRAQVGLTYRQQGTLEATKLGIELVAGSIPAKISTIKRLAESKEIILYCWRGGMRSKAMGDLLDQSGIPSYRLIGGYKAFRRFVNEYLNNESNIPNFLVLYGLTGVGKTEIIENLNSRGVPNLNLEKMANHRGSVFGSVGLGKQPSQKRFETRIYEMLRLFKNSKVLVVEGESRKIGKLTVPEKIYAALQKGQRALVYDGINNRVERIIQEYLRGPDQNLEVLKGALNYLQRRIGTAKVNMLINYLDTGRIREAVYDLLVNYYDVLYKHPDKPSDEYVISVNANNVEQAAAEIKNYLDKMPQ